MNTQYILNKEFFKKYYFRIIMVIYFILFLLNWFLWRSSPLFWPIVTILLITELIIMAIYFTHKSLNYNEYKDSRK
jgi:hypothetical protein